MTTAIWSKRNQSLQKSAPCTIFSTTSLSPRQIANKAYSLGCKKLDRDDKRSKQKYHVRERLLLCNTIAKAEEVLNARTRRTNRRVMAAEDEEESSTDEFSLKKQAHHPEHLSKLRSSSSEEDENDEEEEEQVKIPPIDIHAFTPPTNISSLSIASSSSLSRPRDCRINNIKNHTSNTPIATII